MKAKVASCALIGSLVLGMSPAYANELEKGDQHVISAESTFFDGDSGVAAGGQLFVASNEEYVHTFGSEKAAQQGLTYLAATDSDAVEDSTASDNEDISIAVDDAPTEASDPGEVANEGAIALSHWSVVKFSAHDADGRYIPTRQGNRAFEWVHFSGPHNLHNKKVIKVAVSEHPESGSTRTRKWYGAVIFDRVGIIIARVRVLAQYHWETTDHK